jgi:hypothetical protein
MLLNKTAGKFKALFILICNLQSEDKYENGVNILYNSMFVHVIRVGISER